MSGGKLGKRMGQTNTCDDLDLANGGVLLPSAIALTAALKAAEEEEYLRIQNVGHCAALPALSVGENTVDSVSEIIYLPRQ